MFHRLATVLGCVLAATSAANAAGALELIDGRVRADRDFSYFSRFWREKPGQASQLEAIDAPFDGKETKELGASIHVAFRNTSSAPIKIDDVRLGGVSLKSAIVYSDQRKRKKFASIFFSKLPKSDVDHLVACGEPIWWKVDPITVPPGGSAEALVRLRQFPKEAKLSVAVVAGQNVLNADIIPTLGQPRIRGVYFSPALDRVYAFVEPNGREAPRSIWLDGQDVTGASVLEKNGGLSCIPITIKTASPLAQASFHVLQLRWDGQTRATVGARAWSTEMVYGMFGGKPGHGGDDAAVGRAYLDDITQHNINVQMPQLGSGAVQGFLKSPEGQSYWRSKGLRAVTLADGKWGINDPLIYYVHDEPDAGDDKMQGVEVGRKIGGMAQWCLEHAQELHDADPLTPQMINIDSTFKPSNWYIYGQLSDLFATDPYFQSRQADAYRKRTERIPLYQKITYLYAVASVAESACAPRPLHVILNCVEHKDASHGTFRFGTAEEKRIELYYALAAGAKGFSYWWYTPGNKSNGIGAAGRDPVGKQLWREIGRLGAEVRTAAPIIQRSCPADVKVNPSNKSLWTRCLLADDSVVLLAMNDNYHTDEAGTTVQPLDKVTCQVFLPAWLAGATAFEVSSKGLSDVKMTGHGAETSLDLGRVDLTRMVIITRDKGLRARLAERYQRHFAANASALEEHR